MLFSGQGSQYVGMGRKLYDQHDSVKSLFDSASRTLELDMRQLCFEGPAEVLNQTENTQPALLLCSIAEYRIFLERTGLSPALLAGHSLGELSALVAADAMSLDDGLKLARARGLAMSRCSVAGQAGMRAVTGIDRAMVEEICRADPGYGSQFVIANYNAPRQCVLSGSQTAMEAVAPALKEAGGAVIALKVSGPFHSPFMAPAAEQFAAVLEGVELRRPRIPVIANIDARPHGERAAIAEALVRQITSPVLWSDTMQWLRQESVELFVEAGPRSVLKKLAVANLPDARALALDEADDQPALEKAFAAELRSMRERPSLVGKCMAVAVSTRNNNWDDDAYQQGVIEPYRQLQALQERLDSEGQAASAADMKQALDLLGRIFATKGTAREEQQWRLEQILATSGAAEALTGYAFSATE